MLAIAAGAFIVLAIVVMTFVFRWFMKVVNSILETQQKTLDAILRSQTSQENKLEQIKETLTGEILNQIRVLMAYAFESNQHAICTTVIANIKENNETDDRKATEKKVIVILNNIYKKLKSDIDAFQYNGRKLSEFFSDEWVALVNDYCVKAIYDGKKYHREPYLRGLDTIFKTIKIEFFENLKKM